MDKGLHHNTAYWQRPHEFLPERFDPNDPLYLTEEGKQRNTFAYFPFLGGQRICLGKTFAMINMQFLMQYMTQFFELEFSDKDKVTYAGESDYPYTIAF